jgi:DnaK suppressor protein
MTGKQLEKYRTQLRALADRVGGTVAALEEEVRTPTGGQSAGNLSNAPMHLGDVGTEVYTQELNSTLLENEAHIRDESLAALERIENGTYGRCENCNTAIPAERLDAIPYTRYCVGCAAKLQAGAAVNFNEGRPQTWPEGYAPRGDGSEVDTADLADDVPVTDREDRDDERADTHAAGTPGGGTAVGGLAGTTLGEGDPNDAGLEDAMGSGNFDAALADDATDTTAYSGPAGGAVGGTPAGKRATGGTTRGGTAPRSGPGSGPVGE